MDPNIGRTLTNISDLVTGDRTEVAEPFISPEFEFAVGASPLSRYSTFARTITDPRKWENPLYMLSNLGTGVKVSQVSPGARDAIERGRIAQELKQLGGRNFSTPYIPEYRKEDMDQAESTRAEELLARLKELTAQAKKRRLEKEARAAQ